MTFAFVRVVLEAALLLAFTRVALGALWWWETRRGLYPTAKPWLHAAYALAVASVLLPMAMLYVVPDLFFLAPFEVGHHPNLGNLQLGLRPGARVTNPVTGHALAFAGVDLSWAHWLALTAGVMAIGGGGRLCLQIARLARMCRRAATWKEHGCVRIAVGTSDMVPFCAWMWRGWVVVIPPQALDDRRRLRMIVAHEFAHIRHKHLPASWLLACLAALTPWNPAVRSWQRWIAHLQEIACDQYVVARKTIEPFG